MPKHRRTIPPKDDAQSIGFAGLLAGLMVIYFIAEIVLGAEPHPYHWLAGGVGAVVAGGAAYGLTLWLRTRGHHRR